MFTIQLEQCGKAALEKESQKLIDNLGETLVKDEKKAFEMWAHIKSIQKILETVCKSCEPSFNLAWRQFAPVGKQQLYGDYVFCVTDKPDYDYAAARNDNNGLYRDKMNEILENKEEAKTLTEELNGIKARILKNHPNMAPTHHYTLVYNGTKEDVLKLK